MRSYYSRVSRCVFGLRDGAKSSSKAQPFSLITFYGPSPEQDQCQWYTWCLTKATHMANHPDLGWIPACDFHARRAENGR